MLSKNSILFFILCISFSLWSMEQTQETTFDDDWILVEELPSEEKKSPPIPIQKNLSTSLLVLDLAIAYNSPPKFIKKFCEQRSKSSEFCEEKLQEARKGFASKYENDALENAIRHGNLNFIKNVIPLPSSPEEQPKLDNTAIVAGFSLAARYNQNKIANYFSQFNFPLDEEALEPLGSTISNAIKEQFLPPLQVIFDNLPSSTDPYRKFLVKYGIRMAKENKFDDAINYLRWQK